MIRHDRRESHYTTGVIPGERESIRSYESQSDQDTVCAQEKGKTKIAPATTKGVALKVRGAQSSNSILCAAECSLLLVCVIVFCRWPDGLVSMHSIHSRYISPSHAPDRTSFLECGRREKGSSNSQHPKHAVRENA